ncbi:MAG: hypothetical protein CM15mP25_6300 [Gammaproteobacteria bacterium]|nr:MAG: hypothetical protein CM15mP25_6300 [Gammaproteobacteria bacterium]
MRWPRSYLRTYSTGRLRGIAYARYRGGIAELERAITELDLLGAYIGTDIGRPLNDPD